jgi:hypothetical protein
VPKVRVPCRLPVEVADRKSHLERRASREATRKALLARHRQFKLATSIFIATPLATAPGNPDAQQRPVPYYLRDLPSFDGVKSRYSRKTRISEACTDVAAAPLPRCTTSPVNPSRQSMARRGSPSCLPLTPTNVAPLTNLLDPLFRGLTSSVETYGVSRAPMAVVTLPRPIDACSSRGDNKARERMSHGMSQHQSGCSVAELKAYNHRNMSATESVKLIGPTHALHDGWKRSTPGAGFCKQVEVMTRYEVSIQEEASTSGRGDASVRSMSNEPQGGIQQKLRFQHRYAVRDIASANPSLAGFPHGRLSSKFPSQWKSCDGVNLPPRPGTCPSRLATPACVEPKRQALPSSQFFTKGGRTLESHAGAGTSASLQVWIFTPGHAQLPHVGYISPKSGTAYLL